MQELQLLSLSRAEVTYCFIVILFAYALRGGTGFGAATAMPLLAFVVPMKILVPAWSVLSVVAGIDILRRDYDKIAWADLLPLIPSFCSASCSDLRFTSYSIRQRSREDLGCW